MAGGFSRNFRFGSRQDASQFQGLRSDRLQASHHVHQRWKETDQRGDHHFGCHAGAKDQHQNGSDRQDRNGVDENRDRKEGRSTNLLCTKATAIRMAARLPYEKSVQGFPERLARKLRSSSANPREFSHHVRSAQARYRLAHQTDRTPSCQINQQASAVPTGMAKFLSRVRELAQTCLDLMSHHRGLSSDADISIPPRVRAAGRNRH